MISLFHLVYSPATHLPFHTILNGLHAQLPTPTRNPTPAMAGQLSLD